MYCYKCGLKQEVDNKFCPSCGVSFLAPNNSSVLTGAESQIKRNKKSISRKILFSVLTPVAFLVVIVLVWGLVNSFSADSGTETGLFRLVNSLAPIFVGLSMLMVPAGVLLGIYFYLTRDNN